MFRWIISTIITLFVGLVLNHWSTFQITEIICLFAIFLSLDSRERNDR